MPMLCRSDDRRINVHIKDDFESIDELMTPERLDHFVTGYEVRDALCYDKSL